MVQGVNIPLTMTDQTRGAVNAARNGVKRLSMDANQAARSVNRAAIAGQGIGRAGGVIGQAGSALGSAAGGRLGAIGGALGGMLSLGPLGIAIGGVVAGITSFTSALEESSESLRNQLAGERAMRDARERGEAAVSAQRRGAAGRLGVMQEAAAVGMTGQDLASRVRSTGLDPASIIASERARQSGMSESQLYAAFVIAESGMGSMADALKAAKSLGRNATPEDVLLRMRGEQLTASGRANAGAELQRVQAFRSRSGFGVGGTIDAMRAGDADALGRDFSALQSGATQALIESENRMAQDPVQAEAEKALKQLGRAYSDAWEANQRLYQESGTAARIWRQAFGNETKVAVDAARTQYTAAIAQ